MSRDTAACDYLLNPFPSNIYYLGNKHSWMQVQYNDQYISEALSTFRVANFMVHGLDSNS
jgi:hypothetical protein